MKNMDDFINVLNKISLNTICNEYNLRQKMWEKQNNEIVTDFLNLIYPKWKERFNSNPKMALRNIMTICFNSKNERLINQLDVYLKSYNYKEKSELILIMILIDYFRNNIYDFEELVYYLKGFKSFINIYYDEFKDLNLSLIYGSGIINESHIELGIENIPLNERRQQCHFLTESALCEFPKLYGAYYYLPKCFKGYAEHSVLIDYNKKVVYDLANNISLPLKLFSDYYSNPSFIIKGEDFIELDKIAQGECGQCLSMYQIEAIKKMKK